MIGKNGDASAPPFIGEPQKKTTMPVPRLCLFCSLFGRFISPSFQNTLPRLENEFFSTPSSHSGSLMAVVGGRGGANPTSFSSVCSWAECLQDDPSAFGFNGHLMSLTSFPQDELICETFSAINFIP